VGKSRTPRQKVEIANRVNANQKKSRGELWNQDEQRWCGAIYGVSAAADGAAVTEILMCRTCGPSMQHTVEVVA
jgi:hypothetical protein